MSGDPIRLATPWAGERDDRRSDPFPVDPGPGPSFVYLLAEKGPDGKLLREFVKIGFTRRTAKARAAGCSTGNPRALAVLAERPGDHETERRLHALFRELRSPAGGSEWFRWAAEIFAAFGIEEPGDPPEVLREAGRGPA